SLPALRILPAIASATVVLLAGLMARRMGASRFGQGIAALAVVWAPVDLALGSIWSMNAFDLLLWTLAAWLLVRLIATGDRKLWIPIGIVLGIGLLNKISVLWLGFGIGIGLLL